MAKRILEKSYAPVQILKSDNESEPVDSIKEQYLDAVKQASQLPKGTRLETFNGFHQKCASHLINAFYRKLITSLTLF